MDLDIDPDRIVRLQWRRNGEVIGDGAGFAFTFCIKGGSVDDHALVLYGSGDEVLAEVTGDGLMVNAGIGYVYEGPWTWAGEDLEVEAIWDGDFGNGEYVMPAIDGQVVASDPSSGIPAGDPRRAGRDRRHLDRHRLRPLGGRRRPVGGPPRRASLPLPPGTPRTRRPAAVGADRKPPPLR